MRLSTYTDYALRSLIYLNTHRENLVTIPAIAEAHGISRNHLMKVIHQLGVAGFVETVRGRNGGLKLAKAPDDINIGAVVRLTEKNFDMAECFDRDSNACRYHPGCTLKAVLSRATAAFLAELDQVTLVDLTVRKQLGVARPVRFRAIAM